MPRKFVEVLDEQNNQVLLRVRDSATSVWTMEVLFDHIHEIMAGHFLVFNYDRERTLTVTVFDDTMCCRHYTPTTLANAASSFSDDNK
jgi:hypothetical protein